MDNKGDWVVSISGVAFGILTYNTGKAQGYIQCLQEVHGTKENNE